VPITSVFWARGSERDIHVLRGQSTRDLRVADLAFGIPGAPGTQFAAPYLAANTDVSLVFMPLFKGTLVAPSFNGDGNGISVDTRSGTVTVTAGPPARRKNNFILEVEARNAGNSTPLTEVIRVQIHTAVNRVWLTPDRLTVRPIGPLPETSAYRFSVRAQFDDGVVGDLTDGHGVVWSATKGGVAHPIDATGRLILAPGDNAGHTIEVTATLPATLGGGTAQAQLRVGTPWSAEPSPPRVAVVPGGGWPGTLNPAEVANVLILPDAFMSSDQAAFDRIVNTFVHHLKNTRFVRPFDVLATSINFWKAFVPAADHAISVRSEVFTFSRDGKQVARPLPPAEKPPATGAWSLGNLIYAVGLPVPGEESRSTASLKSEWAQLVSPDPGPRVADSVVDEWRFRARRTFIEERDASPAVAYGRLPAANATGYHSLSPHEERGGDHGLRSLTAVLQPDPTVTLPAGMTIGQIWTAANPAFRFDNTGLVVILSSFPGGRATNSRTQISLTTENGDVDIPIKPAAPGVNAFFVDLPTVPNTVSKDRCRTFAHELGHSFGLGDEYVDFDRPFPRTEADLTTFGNLQTDGDARVGGVLNSAEIKWNWQRIRKAAVVTGAITQAGGMFLVPLQRGGLQFTMQDRLLLRLRPPGALRKASLVLPDTLAATQELQLAAPPGSNVVSLKPAPGSTVTMADVTRFGAGSILFAPTLAPASAGVRYAPMIARNIADFINATNRPLTVWPCVKDTTDVVTPIIPGVSLPGLCFKHKPKIVGLYSGGDAFACGIFHPTGTCMMRTHDEDDSEFCAVCRYIAVDMIDPYHHEEIDRDYDDIYPLR
jgi:hypothetical protein